MPYGTTGVLSAHQTAVTLFNRLLDALTIPIGLLLVLRLTGVAPSTADWLATAIAVICFHLASEFNQLYVSWRGVNVLQELRAVAFNWFVAASLTFMVVYLTLHVPHLQGAQKAWWFVATLSILVGYRYVLRYGLRVLRAQGRNTRSVVIIGAGPVGQKLAANILSAPWMGLVVKGFYDDKAEGEVVVETGIPGLVGCLPILGPTHAVAKLARKGGVDRIYVALPMRAEAKMKSLVAALSDSTASVYLVPDIFMFELLHARAESINGVPAISIFESPLDGSNAIIKRTEDIVVSCLILALIALPMLAIAAAVKLTSKGPAIFKQRRYGLDGRAIDVWKFRSMNVMDNGPRVLQATQHDPRLTPIGGFLRRTSLDELPQFLNVLQGRMSIVGPRPHAVAHNEEYRKLISGYMLRHKVKPGITGWAQINGWRGETDTLDKMEKRIEHDLEYIRRWNLWLDIKIIYLTIFRGFVDRNAY